MFLYGDANFSNNNLVAKVIADLQLSSSKNLGLPWFDDDDDDDDDNNNGSSSSSLLLLQNGNQLQSLNIHFEMPAHSNDRIGT